MRFLGLPYPITKHPRGLMRTQSGMNQIKSDLLCLLLTNPGERIMLPGFGTPLRQLVFEPNDPGLAIQAREMIIRVIEEWEPRVVIEEIAVTNSVPDGALNEFDALEDTDYILGIAIKFFDPEEIDNIQELKLELPLAGKATANSEPSRSQQRRFAQ